MPLEEDRDVPDAAENPAVDPQKLTPMVRQYQAIKSRHRDKILLFRLGDFYEMFDADARTAAGVLHIALTSRNEIPMCGFPFHAAGQYIRKLLDAGLKIAVCEQLDLRPSQAKGIVKRDIVSVITPGTVTDEALQPRPQNNFFCSLFVSKNGSAVSFFDVATGDLDVVSLPGGDSGGLIRALRDDLARYQPSELVVNEGIRGLPGLPEEIGRIGIPADTFPDWYFTDEFLKSRSGENNLPVPEGVRENQNAYHSLMGAFHYALDTQGVAVPDFVGKLAAVAGRVNLVRRDATVLMDDFTIRNLELTRNMRDGSRKFTLLDTVDATVTSMGGRMLHRWIVQPLADLARLRERQNAVEAFYDDTIRTARVRGILEKIGDIERLATRISLRKAIPRELPALSESLKNAAELKKALAGTADLAALAESIEVPDDVIGLIDRAIRPEPPSVFEGDVIREGYNPDLDALRRVLHEGKDWILRLQDEERRRTGIASLKVKFNNVFGYFIEISKANLDAVPPHYVRKQSLSNAERYTIPELSEHELAVTSAGEKIAKLEEEIFQSVLETVARSSVRLQAVGLAVALADVYAALASVAKDNGYVKPELTDEMDFVVEDGRHPVVERHIGRGLFVPNDTILDSGDNRILVITGPNMAGKSTYLRQNALIAVMAQIGAFVPARKARLGLLDKIFTRIGASDDLSQGRSTFLVEMQEAANILRGATEKSLIIMDELGRGTSTYDGLSIAWAVIEYLHEHPEKGGKTLFATHYHELTKLGEKKGVRNFNIAVREYRDELVFLRKVVPGPADKSYGIYVAKLAGLPAEILERAKIVLETLEKEGRVANERIEAAFDRDYRADKPELKRKKDMMLFPDDRNGDVIERIKNLDLDRMTPLESLAFLSELKKSIRD